MKNLADYYFRLMQLGASSNTVILNRMFRLMTGHPDSPQEIERMVREKIALSERILHGLETDLDFDEVLKDIEDTVAQNKQRLSGS